MKKLKRKYKILLASVTALFVICMVLTAVTTAHKSYADSLQEDSLICEGIYIDDISLGGMDQAQAQEAVDAYIEERTHTPLYLKINGDTIDTTLEELGYACEENDYITQALEYGKNGNVVERYKQQEDVKNENIVYTLSFTLDEGLVDEFLKENCAAYEIEPVNASLERGDSGFVITDSQTGVAVDHTATYEDLMTAVNEWDGSDIVVEASVEIIEPEITREQCERCTEVIGSYNTYAGTYGNRVLNIQNAVRLINGTVLYPGETFSTEEHLVPFTEENGYYPAGAYSQGKVINELGGGVCQVSSTLYNAVLLAELDVVERSPHSMIVSYVKPSMDAAIAEGYKDFKFENNTDTPVYIEGYTSNGYIYFNIYGEETRADNRKVEYVSETTKTIQPGKDVITKDPNQPTSYREVTQAAHTGYEACLWKVVTVDGVEQSREKVNYSYYSPSPNYVTQGTKEEEENTDKDKDKDKDKDDGKKEENTKPQETPKPEKPEKPDEKPEKPTEKPAEKPADEPEKPVDDGGEGEEEIVG